MSIVISELWNVHYMEFYVRERGGGGGLLTRLKLTKLPKCNFFIV